MYEGRRIKKKQAISQWKIDEVTVKNEMKAAAAAPHRKDKWESNDNVMLDV